ncbi:MAG: FAD-dependent oxidoreductase [Piscirickettsiaceae bacterium]|nr:FAD-dependent oxidoreductase [Piscirickettsiaceae bacterium]
MSMKNYSADVVIIGAGITGLWIHNCLNNINIHSLLLENNSIGNAQTLSSQGIIHGGTKYAIDGILSKATQSISDMPARWRACLNGKGDIDLRGVRIFTNHQLMWSKDRLSSKMASFFSSKALHSRVQIINEQLRPEMFRHINYTSQLYRLNEPVLDIVSMIRCLVTPWQERIMKISNDSNITWSQKKNKVQSLTLDRKIHIAAQQFVLTAGEGNEALLTSLGMKKPAMQRRPLRMLLCKSTNKAQILPIIYAHILISSWKLTTITSHFDENDNIIWYIGGSIAELSIGDTPKQLTAKAEILLNNLMPWLKLPTLKWAAHTVNRAEPKQSTFSRPDTSFIESIDNIHIAWPTKLALAPNLSDKVITVILRDIKPTEHEKLINVPAVTIGKPLWDRAFK